MRFTENFLLTHSLYLGIKKAQNGKESKGKQLCMHGCSSLKSFLLPSEFKVGRLGNSSSTSKQAALCRYVRRHVNVSQEGTRISMFSIEIGNECWNSLWVLYFYFCSFLFSLNMCRLSLAFYVFLFSLLPPSTKPSRVLMDKMKINSESRDEPERTVSHQFNANVYVAYS